MLFPGFRQERRVVGDVEINFRIGGSGPPVLLLHGFPQTHVMWHRVAPVLARRLTVVAADLRGYGDSAKPPSDASHAAYSKRTMAGDMTGLMRGLGFGAFAVVGHDRGARCAYRMALDDPQAVARLALLDIVPTHTVWTRMNKAVADRVYHWLFLAQPDGLPETMIGRDPAYYLTEKLRRWSARFDALAPEAIAEYLRCYTPESIHATCEDYRAGATLDLEHDAADLGRRQITCPTLVLWGQRAIAQAAGDVLDAWRPWCADLRGSPIVSGHFLAEEAPEATLAELEAFL